MNGDLSLSRALGGLRIANLSDDSDQESSPPPNRTLDADDDHLNGQPSARPLDHSASTHPSTTPSEHTVFSEPSDTRAKRSHERQPDSLLDSNSNLQRQSSTRQSPPMHDIDRASYAPPRPTSDSYSIPPSATHEGEAGPSSYNPALRPQSSRSSMYNTGIAPSRSNSRSVRAPYNGPVPQRTPSYRNPDRRHDLPSGPPGPPPRKSSKGQAGYYANVAGVPMVPEPSNNNFGSQMPPPGSREEWQERGAAVGVRREVDSEGKTVLRPVKKGVKDFTFGTILGEGSYSTVYAATDRQSLKEYAIKVLEKKHIIKEKKIKYVNIEKNTLNRLTEHPGIVRLYYTFQDETSLYYVLDLCTGGELLGVLKRTGTFDEECTRFYGAQILDAIEYMHSRGVIHRDLKPENVLLDGHMHVKVTDFGTAKLMPDPREPIPPEGVSQPEPERAASFVGTAEYVSPELLTDKSAGKASDIWAFGCIIYQLLAGRPPFKGGSEYLTFQKIVGLEYDFPAGFPSAARDLVERCLVLDPTRRLTVEHIKNHEFFDGQKFGKSLWEKRAPRLKPYVPPAQEPHIIQLNGNSGGTSSSSRGMQSSNGSTARPSRIITELPPPTQLDIEWSPVLTRNNERILKLGDLLVTTSPLPNSPRGKQDNDTHRKISRFFGGSTLKKKQRLVMVTSSGRVVLAPAGGDEKKAKQEIPLLSPDCVWRTQIDVKGQVVWCIDVVSSLSSSICQVCFTKLCLDGYQVPVRATKKLFIIGH